MFASEKFKTWLGARADPPLVAAIAARLAALNSAIEKDPALGLGFSIGYSFFCPELQEKDLDEQWFQRIVKTEIEPLN